MENEAERRKTKEPKYAIPITNESIYIPRYNPSVWCDHVKNQ